MTTDCDFDPVPVLLHRLVQDLFAFDAAHDGQSACWGSLLDMCYPCLANLSLTDKLMAIINRTLYNRDSGQCHFSWVEYCAGAGLSRALLKNHQVSGFLWMHCLRLILVHLFGLEHRAQASYPYVSLSARGERKTSTMATCQGHVSTMLGNVTCLEQPLSSVLPLLPTLRNVLSYVQSQKVVTLMVASATSSDHGHSQLAVLVSHGDGGSYTGIPSVPLSWVMQSLPALSAVNCRKQSTAA